MKLIFPKGGVSIFLETALIQEIGNILDYFHFSFSNIFNNQIQLILIIKIYKKGWGINLKIKG